MQSEVTKLKPNPLKHQCIEKQSSSTHCGCLFFSSLPIRQTFTYILCQFQSLSCISGFCSCRLKPVEQSPFSHIMLQCDLMGSQSWTVEVHSQIIPYPHPQGLTEDFALAPLCLFLTLSCIENVGFGSGGGSKSIDCH